MMENTECKTSIHTKYQYGIKAFVSISIINMSDSDA